MRKDIDHLPPVQQAELERAKQILMAEFEVAISRATQPWKKNGRIQKIVLFGSYARSDWVDQPLNGYQSDFDLLIIVSHPKLTDIAEYWHVADDKIDRDPSIERQVNFIVHTMDEVNQSLNRGEYFWVDIARDGIALYELPGSTFVTPKPLTPADGYEMAAQYFAAQSKSVQQWIDLAEFSLQMTRSDADWARKTAFNLHQAVETCYICFLLVRTLYFPRSHNIKFLRSFAEGKEPRLIRAWPRETKLDRRRFELLKRAYVEARYSTSYEISVENLEAITERVHALRGLVDLVCQERLAQLREKARHDIGGNSRGA
ncbi:HEPN domain-containing protein [Novosphingobium sp. ST904]|uniref:HEPN domain-containing protein n=1 Tax=Novosphingobium sp. ST904 TaxID=1684385 RepID=UPI0006C8E460|nr:HEPN domain-containing protein [Novosphingobium sp. ST904]KPH66091.1 DNA-binding protein [Novosphingobium sp. ST904]TCM27784.1 putative nucleotidyltransferase [Novosphingobium sp. ST904]